MDLPKRPRRLRTSPALRAMVRETALAADDFILPLFVSEKLTAPAPVASLPGVFQLTEKALVEEAAGAYADGVPAVLLFGIPAHKDEQATQAYAADGVVQRAVRALKSAVPELLVITVCASANSCPTATAASPLSTASTPAWTTTPASRSSPKPPSPTPKPEPTSSPPAT